DLIDAATIQSHLEQRHSSRPADGGADFESALDNWLSTQAPPSGMLYHSALAAFEKPLFEHALGETSGNQLRAAQLLGINRNTLRKRLLELEIDAERFTRRS